MIIPQLWSIVLSVSLSAITPNSGVAKLNVKPSILVDETVETESSPQLFTISRERPWLIPGQSQFSGLLTVRDKQIGGTSVQEKVFQCSGELPPADIDFYYMRSNGQLYVRTALLALQNLSSFSLEGRTFAYRATFVKVGVRSDGKPEYLGAVFILYFYDEDGDGELETRYGDLENLKLPNWFIAKRAAV